MKIGSKSTLLHSHLASGLNGGTGRSSLVHSVTARSFKLDVGLTPRPAGEVFSMDEAQTLRYLAWTVGGLVGAVFVPNAIANAIALSLI
jgi:hypothetical protein